MEPNRRGFMMFRKLVIALALTATSLLPANAQFAAQQTWVQTGGGTANAQTVNVPNITSLGDLVGVPVRYIPSVSNTGATTIAPTSLTATAVRNITSAGLEPLIGGELRAGAIAIVIYDGTYFELVNNAVANTVINPNSGVTTYNTNGTYTFTVPANIYILKSVQAWGGGGGGGGCGSSASSVGGAGGGYGASYNVPVIPGQTISVTVGAGGIGGINGSTDGSPGGTTTVGSILTATGGQQGGAVNSGYGGTAASGGIGTGQVNYKGGFGNVGGLLGTVYVWGFGGGTYGGYNTADIGFGANGETGIFPGGGGSGCADTSGPGFAGGAGIYGQVIITY